jgi:hypothetical protein
LGIALPIRTLMPEEAFTAEETEIPVSTYERVCRTLSIDAADDPLRIVVASKVIFIATQGVCEPEDLYFNTLKLVTENF